MTKVRILSIALVGALSLFTMPASAGNEGRIAGTVVDPEGKPVEGAAVAVIGREVETRKEATTNRKGKFSMLVLDATRDYDLRIEAEGYDLLEEPIKLAIGGVLRASWTLYPVGSRGPSQAEMARIEAHNRAARSYNEGAALFDQEKYEEALELMEVALEEKPELAPALVAVARIYLELGDAAPEAEKPALYEKSLEAAVRVRPLLPEEPLPVELIHDTLLALGRAAEAEEVLAELAAMEAASGSAAVRYFQIGVRAIRANELAKAKGSFERSAELRPELKEAYLNLALIAQAEERWPAVVDQTGRYLELDPRNARAMTMRYEAYQAMGNKAEADATFAQLAAADPASVADTFFTQGTELWNKGQTVAAQTAFERVLAIVPDHPRAHFQLGLCYASAAQPDEAKKFFTRFIELAPDDPEVETARQMLGSL